MNYRQQKLKKKKLKNEPVERMIRADIDHVRNKYSLQPLNPNELKVKNER